MSLFKKQPPSPVPPQSQTAPHDTITDFVGDMANTLIDEIKVAIILIDLRGTILYANKEACRIMEYENGTMNGVNMYKFLSPDILPQAMKSVAMDYLGAPSPGMDIVVTTKSGKKKTMRFPTWNSSVIETARGKSMLMWGMDVTEEIQIKKQLENQIKEIDAMNKFMIGRENKMAELKKENERLKTAANK